MRITPRGLFSLERAHAMSFGPVARNEWDGVMRLAFVADGGEAHAAVALRQADDGTVTAEVQGGASADAVERQVARILSLDVDGSGWPAVGEADPVIGELQGAFPGQRPVVFSSPYEAAAWAIMSARRSRAQAMRTAERVSAELGASFEVAGRTLHAFPLPDRLVEIDDMPGVRGPGVERMRAVGEAARDGLLDAEELRAMDPDDASAELQRLPGIGPFWAGLIVVRALGHADVLPADEPRLRAAVAERYGLVGPPDSAELARVAEAWRPYRTWASVLLRIGAEAEAAETG